MSAADGDRLREIFTFERRGGESGEEADIRRKFFDNMEERSEFGSEAARESELQILQGVTPV